jgi:hypothetical protein
VEYFNIFLENLFDGGFDIDTTDIRCCLAEADGNDPATEIDAATLSAFYSGAGFAGSEFDGANYARKVLAGVADARDDTLDLVKLSADDYTISSLGAGTNPVKGALIYAHVTDDTDSWPIAWLPYASNQNPSGADFPVSFHADGFCQIKQAAGSADVRFFNVMKSRMVNGLFNFATDDVRIALAMNDATNDCMTETDEDTLDAFFSAAGFDTVEFDGANYARQILAGKSVSTEYGNDLVRLVCTDPTIASLGAGTYNVNGVLVYLHVTDDSDSIPLFYRKFSPEQTPDGSTFDITFGTNKLCRIAKA